MKPHIVYFLILGYYGGKGEGVESDDEDVGLAELDALDGVVH